MTERRVEFDTRGRTALAGWFAAAEGRWPAELARVLGVERALVSMWLSGATRPGSLMRELLEVVCGIDARAWLTDEERASLARIEKKTSDAA